MNFLQNSFAETAIPLILSLATLLINDFAEPKGLALFFNIILLVGGVILLKRVLEGRIGNWMVFSLGVLSIGMPLFALANMVEILAPSIQTPFIRELGYGLVTLVVTFNFFSLIVSVRMEKKALTIKEVKTNEIQKNVGTSINSGTFNVSK